MNNLAPPFASRLPEKEVIPHSALRISHLGERPSDVLFRIPHFAFGRAFQHVFRPFICSWPLMLLSHPAPVNPDPGWGEDE